MTEATHARVAVNGVELYARSIGLGPDVVVLHGGPGAHHDYLLPQYDSLAVGRRLNFYDQRGGGQSPVVHTEAVSWQHHVADLLGLVRHWEVAPVTLLGYSWGGLLALLFASEHPESVGRLALVSPAATHASAHGEFERRFAERMAQPEITTARAELKESGLRQTDPAAYRKKAFELSVAGYFARPGEASELTPFRITDRTYRAVWESLGNYDLRGRFSNLRVPTLVVHGKHDPIPLETARETAELLGGDLTILDDCGHVPHVENPAAFFDALDGFLPSNP